VFAQTSETSIQLDTRLLEEAWSAFLEGEPLGTVFYSLWLDEPWRRSFRLSIPSAREASPVLPEGVPEAREDERHRESIWAINQSIDDVVILK